jgi:F0F1-type ATP synthase membrane subunit b/b'
MKVLLIIAFSILLVVGVSFAQRPAEDISPERHPNLAAAQKLVREAWDRINTAQHDNHWDMRGHAQKAKDLLDQASNELKLAAEEANRKGR